MAARKKRMSVEEICELLQIKRPTWRSYIARGQAPAADGWNEPRARSSVKTPWWYESTIEEYRSNRAPWERTNDA